MKIPTPKRQKSGLWAVRLRVNGREETITAETEKEAKRLAMMRKGAMLADKAGCNSRKTLGAAIDDYIADRSAVLSATTLRSYKSMRAHRLQSEMDRPMGDITNWQQIVNREAAGCSPKYMKNLFGLVSAAYRAQGLPVPLVTLPKVQPKERPWLTAEEIDLFMEKLRCDPVEIPALLALHSLRCSEILGLDWKNIKKASLHICEARVLSENGYVDKQTMKNSSSVRTIPIFIPRLEELLEAVPKKKGKVVCSTEREIYSGINRVCRAAELPEVGIHGLRHSFCSLCVSLNIPPDVCQRLGGWSDFATMKKIYTHISEAAKTEAADKLRGYFEK